MEKVKDYRDWSMDDIVFENRNKAYGSYQNKKAVTQHIIIGLTASMLSFVMLVLALTIDWNSLGQTPEEKEKITPVNLSSRVKVNLPPPPAPPPPPIPPPPVRPSVRFTEMVVKKTPEVDVDEYLAWVDEILEQDITTVTNVGDTTVKLVVRETPPPVVKEVPIVDTPVYEFVDQRPEFPGGDKALYEYLSNQ
ncbi:MAG: hypothetical protein V4615_09235, partial [Bacteroidota bacterium]